MSPEVFPVLPELFEVLPVEPDESESLWDAVEDEASTDDDVGLGAAEDAERALHLFVPRLCTIGSDELVTTAERT